MGQIERTIEVYERLRKNRYKITIENGMEIIMSFSPEHYHHLVGYHYLTDVKSVSDPYLSKHRFYRSMKNGAVSVEQILNSVHYMQISERIDYFHYLEEIVNEGEGRIIVDFDKQKADSTIDAKFFLFKRDGEVLTGESVTYYSLFIGYDKKKEVYFPATYIIEHSIKYVSNQRMWNCKIEWID